MADDPCNQDESAVTVPTICLCDFIEAKKPHEPPMGLDSGSFSISTDEALVEFLSPPNPSDPRPHKYRLQDSTIFRGPVAVLRVMTEQSDGGAHFLRYLLPRDVGAQVMVWLQGFNAATPPALPDLDPLPAQPQVLIRGDNILVETDSALVAAYTYKGGRPFGYSHPGYGGLFRIGAWAVVDTNGRIVTENNDPFGIPFRASGDDAYHIYVSFHD